MSSLLDRGRCTVLVLSAGALMGLASPGLAQAGEVRYVDHSYELGYVEVQYLPTPGASDLVATNYRTTDFSPATRVTIKDPGEVFMSPSDSTDAVAAFQDHCPGGVVRFNQITCHTNDSREFIRFNVRLGDGNDRVILGGAGKGLVEGESGADNLRGSNRAGTWQWISLGDELYGGAGDDKIVGLGGQDFLAGEAGRDSIISRDGFADTVYCGSERDNVTADILDQLYDCEVVAIP